MESPTIKKLFPELSSGSEFRPLTFERVATGEEKEKERGKEACAITPRFDTFSLSRHSWKGLLSDAGLRAEFDRRVAEEVEARFTAENASYRAAATLEGRREGADQGLREGREQTELAAARLEAVCRQVLESQEAILHSHEKAWCEAFSRLLRRFLVARGEELELRIVSWLEEALVGFAANQALRISLSKTDFNELQRNIPAGRNWEWACDPSLAPGEIHCESEAGGLFFSASAEAERLETLMREFFPTEASHGA